MWQQCASWDTEPSSRNPPFFPPRFASVPNKTHQAGTQNHHYPPVNLTKHHGNLFFLVRIIKMVDFPHDEFVTLPEVSQQDWSETIWRGMTIFMPKYQMVDIPERWHLQSFEISICNSVDTNECFPGLGFRVSAQLSVKSSFNIMKYHDIMRYLTSVVKF